MLGLKVLFKNIFKVAKSVNSDIKLAYTKYPSGIADGWKQGSRLAQQKDLGVFSSLALRTKGAARKAKVQPEYIPGLLAGATTLIPLPFTSVGGYCIGKGLQYLVKAI